MPPRARISSHSTIITHRSHKRASSIWQEGGTGILDLPGNNTTGAAEIFHTRQGVENAGVVFVLLKRDLAAAGEDLKLMRKCGVVKRALIEQGTVVFLFNRERNTGTHISAEQLCSPEEEVIRKELETKSRIKWKEELSIENGRLFTQGEISRKLTKDEIQAIVDRTEMRCIYPMLYTSWKFNAEHAIAQSVLAEEVCATRAPCSPPSCLDHMKTDRPLSTGRCHSART